MSQQEDESVGEQRKRTAVLFLVLLGMPLLAWLASLHFETRLDEALVHEGWDRRVVVDVHRAVSSEGYLAACGGGLAYLPRGAAELCPELRGVGKASNARYGAAALAALGALLMLAIQLGKRAAGQDRHRLTVIFDPLVRFALVAVALLMVGQAALLFYVVVELESLHATGFLFSVGVGAVLGFFQLLKSAFGLMKSAPQSCRAERLDPAAHAGLFQLVDRAAARLRAERPDAIVAGLDANFFVTSSPLRLLPEDVVLAGRTLYVSLPLLRILSTDELAAVVGHELGHYRGQDTEYSSRFAPIYARLTGAIRQMGSGQSAIALAQLPARAVLNACLTSFAAAQRAIGRERELLADKAGAEVAGTLAAASALVKVSLYADLWAGVMHKQLSILGEGRYFENLPRTYARFCATAHQSLDWAEARTTLTAYRVPHPIDTHPPVGVRLRSLGVVPDARAARLPEEQDAATTLIRDGFAIEERLTLVEAHWLEASGQVIIPKTPTTPAS